MPVPCRDGRSELPDTPRQEWLGHNRNVDGALTPEPAPQLDPVSGSVVGPPLDVDGTTPGLPGSYENTWSTQSKNSAVAGVDIEVKPL